MPHRPERGPDPRLTLGIDLGTSAVKVVVLDAAGESLATGSAEFATDTRLPLQAEQHCADWLGAVAAACRDVDEPLSLARGPAWRTAVTAVGLTGQLPTLVCLGDTDPLWPAITWKDGRADAWLKESLGPGERHELYNRTGMPIDGRYLGPMWRFHHADRGVAARSILSAKDFLGYALTGSTATDPSTAAGYAAFDLDSARFDRALAARWQLPLAALPTVRAATETLGPLSAAAARLTGLPAGTPVIVGAADSVCSAFAMVGLEEGRACVTMGSSTVILDAVRELRRDSRARYLLTPHVAPGWYGREMDLLATGTGYDWLSRLLGLRAGELDAAAARSRPGAGGVFFAPYLAGGEQGALWNPALNARIDGLNLRHDANDVARAFLEGVCFEIRRCLEVLAETVRLDRICVAGHIAGRSTTLQLLADVLGRPVQPYNGRSPAAIGAALLARAASDDSPPGPGSGNLGPRLAPGPDAAAYGDLYRHYVRLAACC